jgi:hypothetical protein
MGLSVRALGNPDNMEKWLDIRIRGLVLDPVEDTRLQRILPETLKFPLV